MKKVLFIIPFLSSGGAEKVASIWTSELAKLGVDVHLLVFYRVDNEYILDKKVQIHEITKNKNEYDKLSTITKLKRIRGKLKKVKPYVVIPFVTYVGVLTTIAKVGLKIKIIETIRNNPVTTPSGKIFRGMRNISIYFSNKCIVQNKEQFSYFHKCLQKKMVVFFNPIDPEYFSKEKKFTQTELKNIIAVGRLTEQKDYITMIDAMEIVVQKNKNVNLSIYGEGPLYDILNKYIIKKELQNYIKLCGRSNNIIDILSKKDLYLLSSKWEGMPNSLMEAMAIGLPCIATNCETGPSDLIEDGVNGCLVDVEDSVGLAKVIIERIDKVESSIHMGGKARNFILEKYSAQESAKNLLEFIHTV